ncbi:hypothetical protein [Trinickia dabaoshanensis]|nr:hypothetical protein [Trinickia dabaoshanensis]
MASDIDMPSDARPALLRSLRAHADAVSHLGARTMVLSRFLEAALPHLTRSQRQAIAALLRDAMHEAIAGAEAGERSPLHYATLRNYTATVLELLESRGGEPLGAPACDQ